MNQLALKVCLVLSSAVIAPVSAASAQLAIHRAYSYQEASPNSDDESRTSGFLFTLSPVPGSGTGFRVNALGYNQDIFDRELQGRPFAEAQRVGLWDVNGNLLASTTVGPLNFDRAFGGFLWNRIPALNLDPGSYLIGGTSPCCIQYPTNAFGVVTSPGFAWIDARWQEGDALAFPIFNSDRAGPNGFLHVNLSVISRSAIPEPATWAMLLLGFGAIGAASRARKRHNVSVLLGEPSFI